MAREDFLDISEILDRNERKILDFWTKAQADLLSPKKLITEKQLIEESARFLGILIKAMTSGNLKDITAPEYEEVIKFLSNLSASRASQGFSPSETASYIFSLKQTVVRILQEELSDRPEALLEKGFELTDLLDKLGIVTFETYVKGREDVITEQQKSMLELSTPVIQIWDEILVLPLVGTIDSRRAMQIMERLLEGVVGTNASIVIIDITGVPVVDSEMANRLLRSIKAAKVMGAECILTGLSPQISYTIVNMGVDLRDVITRASLRDGLEMAFTKLKLKVIKTEG
jgi:rsbT co-antagonist protein RsbR